MIFVTPAIGSLNKGDLFLLLAITSFIQGARFVFANGAISDPSRFMVFCETMAWGGVGMLTFFELAHILDATLLCLSCVHKHVDVTHLMHINMPRSFLSNILDATPVMGWGEYVNIL